jgi:hypothetical protein
MKPGLEAERHGLAAEDRWVIHPEELEGRPEEVVAAEWLAEQARWERDRPWWGHDDLR